jgi:regulator of protease activity HflC (stomatin/prohibitin superfamily)
LVVLAIVVVLLVLFLALSIKIASEHERAVIFRLGRLLPEIRGPGLFLVLPIVDRMVRVNLLEETPAEAVGAHRFVGAEVIVWGVDTVLIERMPWPARSADGSTLITGEHRQVESVEDGLRLVVGSASSPILEELT